MIRIITDKKKWGELIKQCDFADFYHSCDYHQVSNFKGDHPILIHYEHNNGMVLLPLIIRYIGQSIYKDATSVYGYPGPITKNITSTFNFKLFQEKLTQLFREQNIVSVFSRLNPFIAEQENCLKTLGNIETLGKLVYIDLTQPMSQQWGLYHRRLKTYINKSRTLYSVEEISNVQEVQSFVALYHENMKRVNAKKEYFFELGYFLKLLNSHDFDTKILGAYDKSTRELIGGAMFTMKNTLIQYHISGTSSKYLKLNPLKLLIDEMRIRGVRENYKYLNLGGGVSSKEDSLFYFKSGFSNNFLPFKVWKYKVNEDVYEELVEQLVHDVPNNQMLSEYFPLYRQGEQG